MTLPFEDNSKRNVHMNTVKLKIQIYWGK